MTIELARARKLPKPWGVVDPQPWSEPGHEHFAIGEISYDRSGCAASIPALQLKVLLTSQPLSIQVHPDDAVARSMGLPNGKTEAWYVLSAESGAAVALGLKQSISPPQMRAAIEDGSIADLVAWRAVAAGDIIFVPGGTIHAIGAGLVIAEIQQRSDTTFRLFDYGRGRELHLESALAAANTGPAELQLWPDRLSDERSLLVANPHFIFERIELAANSTWRLVAELETWLLVVDGTAGAGGFDVARGDAVFVEAEDLELCARADGAVCLVAYGGVDGPAPQLLQRATHPDTSGVLVPTAIRLPPVFTQTRASPTRIGPVQ